MKDLRYIKLFRALIILALFLFYEHVLHAQYRQAPARLNLQLERIEKRIEEKNAHIEEVSDKLSISKVVQKSRQLAGCRRRHRFTYMVRCRHLSKELSDMQEEQRYWRRVNKHRREKDALKARKDRLNQQIAEEKRRNTCIAQTRNRRNIGDFLKSEEIKIAQEIDYDSVENGRCNSENNYFQSQIDSSHDDGDFDLSIDKRCTYRALKRHNQCGRRKCFLKCDGPDPRDDSDVEYIRDGPCISRRLHHYTHQALTEVSSCLQIDPKALFSLFVNESGFNPLKKSYTSAVGMGQITGIFIQDINQSYFDDYKNEILPALSRNPLTKDACQSVINKMNKFGKIQKTPLCQRTQLDMNILYSAIHHIRSMNAITKKLLAHKNRSNIPVSENSPFRYALAGDITPRTKNLFKTLATYQTLNPNERRIITELSFYSHNLPKTITLFQTYLNDTRLEGNKLGDNFTGQQGLWRQYLENNKAFISRKENRQNEILGYIYPRKQMQGGLKVLAQEDERAFMRGRVTEVEREGRNKERIYCRPY